MAANYAFGNGTNFGARLLCGMPSYQSFVTATLTPDKQSLTSPKQL